MPKPIAYYPMGQRLEANPVMKEVPYRRAPQVSDQAVICAGAIIVGDVRIAPDVFVGFYNILRADSAPAPYIIGPRTNLQDYVLMHCHPGEYLTIRGRRVGVWLEGENSVLHHAAVHGPLFVGRNTFIGQHASIYGAVIGRHCVIMHGAVITNHVVIRDGRFVAPGQTVATQADADALPPVPEAYRNLNAHIVDHYYRLGKGYHRETRLTV